LYLSYLNNMTGFTKIYFILCIVFLQFNSYAQDSIPKNNKLENYISFQYDNDFFSATDRYYTQGIILSVIHPIVKYSPLRYSLIKLNKNALNYYGFHLEQDVFTPVTIRYFEGTIYYGERPFSAFFLASHSLSSLNPKKKIALHTQFDLGMIGPIAKGEEEQKGIHKALNNIEPLGWQNQLSNDYLINYRIKFEKATIDNKCFLLTANATAKLGSLYTDAGIGLYGQLGIFSNYFSNLGLEKNSVLRKNKFKIYGIAKANFKVVGYNATLQGGIFNSPSIYSLSSNQIKRTVFDCMGGIVLAYKNVSLEYSKFYITPEFTKGVDHGWGKCLIRVGF
jgi:lipid A 3-O-deacylase